VATGPRQPGRRRRRGAGRPGRSPSPCWPRPGGWPCSLSCAGGRACSGCCGWPATGSPV